jgi:hypothetical protein
MVNFSTHHSGWGSDNGGDGNDNGSWRQLVEVADNGDGAQSRKGRTTEAKE